MSSRTVTWATSRAPRSVARWLAGSIEPGDKVIMDVLEGDLYFDVESGAAPFAEDREPAEAPA